MIALHLILGVVGIALGLVMILQRERLTARERRLQGTVRLGPAGWRLWGVGMLALGASQLVLAAV